MSTAQVFSSAIPFVVTDVSTGGTHNLADLHHRLYIRYSKFPHDGTPPMQLWSCNPNSFVQEDRQANKLSYSPS